MIFKNSTEFFNLSFDMLCISNYSGYFVDVSPSWTSALGWSREELLSKPFIEFVHQDDREKTLECARNFIKNPQDQTFENRYLSKKGYYVWLSWRLSVNRDEKLVYAVAKDISDLKKYTSVSDRTEHIAKIGSWEIDLLTDKLSWSKQTYILHETSPEEYTPDLSSAINFYAPESRQIVNDVIQKLIQKQQAYEIEVPLITAKGKRIITKSIGQCESLNGKVIKIYGTFQDITESVKVRDNTKKQQDQLIRFINLAPVAIAMFDSQMRFISTSNRWLKDYNLKNVSLLGRSYYEVFKNTPDSWKEIHNKALNGISYKSNEDRFIDNANNEQWIRWEVVPWSSDSEKSQGVMIITENITELKQSQIKLLETSRLSSLGVMASGVAHEINNPLTIIHGKASLIIRQLKSENPDKEKLLVDAEKIISTAQRIVKIVKGLRTFSRSGEKEPFVDTPIKTLIDDVLEMSKERFKNNNVTLNILNESTLSVSCSITQIGQVLINLLNNSFDAVHGSENPWVEISTDEIEINNQKLVQIKVTDSGNGIPPEVANKLMVPFFTTKGVGKGTGLGLSISKGIIEEHGGRLYIDNNCKNTRFIIELPLKLADSSSDEKSSNAISVA